MEINIISYVPAILGVTLIGIFVLLNSSNVKNKIFAAANFSLALWLAFLFAADISSNLSVALWLFRLALFFGQIMFLLFYYFSLVFPYSTATTVRRQVLYSLPMLVVTVLLLTPLGAASVSIESFGVQPEQAGFIYAFSDVLGIFYIFAGIVNMLLKHRKSNIRQKQQIKFVLIGLSIALVVNVLTGDVLPLLNVNTTYIDFGGISLFVFSLFVAYAMIRHGFLDVKFLVARTMAYTLTLVTVAAVYSAFIFGILSRFIDLSRITAGQQAVYIITAVFLSFTFQPIKQFFNKLTNRLFYRDSYDIQAFLDEFNRILVASYDLNSLLQKSAEVVQKNLKTEYATFLVKKGKGFLSRTASAGRQQHLSREFEEFLVTFQRKSHEKIIAADLLDEKQGAIGKVLQDNEVSILACITQGKDSIGYLVLGPKKSGNLYNMQDRKAVEILANELVIAIQNALRFEEIESFNATLQQRVAEATRKLRRTNEKLKTLDETKDDFISMASHQLRTPLTSVKGYLSMVLEGDAGRLTKAEREMLTQAFVSSQRMVYLIADLLNISRLKTGKFTIEPSPVSLAEMVEQELSQLQETAAARSVTLQYDKPADFPLLRLDETKTRQVIMNFVDNAIYYTPSSGHITVRLLEKPHSIELRVEDNGIGVPKSEQPHLFTKFYRAANARKARPDGTGLGLFMAKKVIVAQGGSIIFESREGEGSTFGFIFPKSLAVSRQAPLPAGESERAKAPEAAAVQ